MTDQEKQSDNRPFSWLLKPSLLNSPTESLAHLLKNRHINVLSETLETANGVIFNDSAMVKKGKRFRAEANKGAKEALDRVYELATLAALRFRQWQFLEYEPSGEVGSRSPDHLMLALEGPTVIVEVKTLHLAMKVKEYEARKKALQTFIVEKLAGRGMQAEVNIYCPYNAMPKKPSEFEPLVPKLIAAVLKNRRRSRLHTSYNLPRGDRVDVNIREKVPPTRHPQVNQQLQKIDNLQQNMAKSYGEMALGLKQGGDFQKILGKRIAEAVQEKDKQIVESGLPHPAIVAVCMGDHKTSVRQAVQGYRMELKRRGGLQDLKAVKAILITSFFDPKFDELVASVSSGPIGKAVVPKLNQMFGRVPLAIVQTCWIPLAVGFDAKPVGKVWDILDVFGTGHQAPQKNTRFDLPIFPKLVKQNGIEPVPPDGMKPSG